MALVRELYSERHSQRQKTADALRRRERRVSLVRLALIAIAVALLFWQPVAAIVPVIAFVVLVIVHERLIRARKQAENGAAFYERGLGRIDGTWQGKGDAGSAFADEHHPYAGDFDLFGRGSLFELISIAVTSAGSARSTALTIGSTRA